MLDSERMEKLVLDDAVEEAAILEVELLPAPSHPNVGPTTRAVVHDIHIVAAAWRTLHLLEYKASPSVVPNVGSCGPDHALLGGREGPGNFEGESVGGPPIHRVRDAIFQHLLKAWGGIQ